MYPSESRLWICFDSYLVCENFIEQAVDIPNESFYRYGLDAMTIIGSVSMNPGVSSSVIDVEMNDCCVEARGICPRPEAGVPNA